MSEATWSQVIDQFGIPWELDEGDIVTDIIILAKIMKEDGQTSFAPAQSPGTDFITIKGMLDLGSDMAFDLLQDAVEPDDD